MDHLEAGRFWDGNAAAWTQLAREGWDLYRDAINTPAFLDLLPDVLGKTGLDVGCGEGHNTRLFAARCARMFAIDISPTFVGFAAEEMREIRHAVASAQELPFVAECFDFVTAVMCLMDLPDHRLALREIQRVMRPGGFLQFSITHPCFCPPYRRILRNLQGEAYATEVGRYFERVDGKIDRWLFSGAPARAKAGLDKFEVPVFHRTVSDWFNAVIEAGLTIERVTEPRADEETARRIPAVADMRAVPYFLHMRCRKLV